MWAGGKYDSSPFPKGGRGGPPEPIVQRRSFDPLSSGQHVVPQISDSWSFYKLGSSRNKRKLPSGKETVSEFSCRHRPPGYYADINLGCEVSDFEFSRELISIGVLINFTYRIV